MSRATEHHGSVHAEEPHESACKHVTGLAEYTDDMAEPVGTLHACLGLSAQAHAAIENINLTDVLNAPGVVGVLTAADIPGCNDISPTHRNDEPVFAEKIVEFHGQPIFAVVAATRNDARRAARRAKVTYQPRAPVVSLSDAIKADAAHVTDPLTLERGRPDEALAKSPRRIKGSVAMGGQDHFYLEGQVALAIPGEDDEITLHVSSQHPGEVQHMTAGVLGVLAGAITVNVRRMGGGFGGKETQANLFAVVAALAAKKYRRAVKLRPDRDDDMIATGKRHDFLIDYDVGFDEAGRILAVKGVFAARCGYSADLSGPVTDRALLHADNAYYYPSVHLRSRPLKTNTVSNTAFRGFGGPQGMIAAERIIEEIAFALGRDPLDIRKANLYGGDGCNVTPYHQVVEDNILPRLIGELENSCHYAARRAAILRHNADNPIIKKGIALTPVKFGISFTATSYNQAGALVHVYQDGSIHLNHGGTEMGQGLLTKVAQVVADCFAVSLNSVHITPTTTGKVPNTSATAASSGADLNGMAAANAAGQIKDRLIDFAADAHSVSRDQIAFTTDGVRIGNTVKPFAEFIKEAYGARVHLSAAGFYKTPDIHWSRAQGRGNPFYYYAYGVAAAEVSLDALSGESQVDRVDILHDAGRSLNPAIDRGQIEGGFIQGMGWLTGEELWWDGDGRLHTHAPSTYKIPLASDVPRVFNVALAQWSHNRQPTIHRSKAVGEPPLMLAISVLEALSMAVASVADYKICPRLAPPATPEKLLTAMDRLRRTGETL